MFEKMQYLAQHHDNIRKRMLRDPRGYPAANCNLILPPVHPEAQAGDIIMEQVESPAMSGTNTICVVTTLLETGMPPMFRSLPSTYTTGQRGPKRMPVRSRSRSPRVWTLLISSHSST